jgi:hypothetical protein
VLAKRPVDVESSPQRIRIIESCASKLGWDRVRAGDYARVCLSSRASRGLEGSHRTAVHRNVVLRCPLREVVNAAYGCRWRGRMLNRDRSADVGFDVVHAGPQAVDDLADLVRRMGEGRAFVLVDDPEGGEVRRYVKSASSRFRMSARIVDVTDAIHTAQQQAEMASQLSAYAGAALISGGGSAVIGAGKTKRCWRPTGVVTGEAR